MMFGLFMASCSDDDNDSSDKKEAVVVYFKNGTMDYWKQMETAIKEECKAKNYEVLVSYVTDDSDIDGQLAEVSKFSEYQKKYDVKGVIIAPIYIDGNHKVEEQLAKFVGSNIPVIVVDSPVDEKNNPLKNAIKAYIGTDNMNAGKNLAETVNAKASTILAARLKNSIPTIARYEGFCEGVGSEVAIWETNYDKATPTEMAELIKQNPDVQNLVFFNGGLCSSVLEACKDMNVYTFDAYKPLFENMLSDNGYVKGIVAQNTFEMGRLAVLAITDSAVKGEILVPTIFISPKTIMTEEARPFMEYFGMSKK